MNDDLTHASFFSGAGGLDLGLERAGWRTVSFSEIDPYASAVLAERWPGVPNLGDITGHSVGNRWDRELRQGRASLWTGGFPCQDLSVAGKRRGMGAGTRSGLAYSFLALVGRYRPRFVLLENVPGLLSSHGGRDMAALIGALVELGYGVGYRMLDARYFGVPQRRRRVFILGDSLGGRAGAERAAEVLSVGSRCRRHLPMGIEAGEGVAEGARSGIDIARAVTGTSGKRHDDDTDTLVPTLRVGGRASGAGSSYDNTPYTVVSSSPDTDRMRAPDGLALGSHDRDGVADPLLPLGLDSHRYRCCGNGVVADVAYWIGVRLRQTIEETDAR